MRSKLILLPFLLMLNVDSVAQSLKTFSGNFEQGSAVYQYYENSQFDRVFHGTFSYTGSMFDMKGNYVDGQKDGQWSITANDKLFSGRGGSIKLNTKITGSYKKGKLEGVWSYTNLIRFAADKEEDKETSTATFSGGHFVDKVSYIASWPENHSVNGEFDNLGFMTGNWTYINGSEKDEIKFMKGVAYWRLLNNTSTGEKKLFCDATEFVKEFWNSYDPIAQTSTIKGKIYYPDTVSIDKDTRVFKSTTIEIGDPWSFQASGEDYNNPICIWINDHISVFASGALSNPLYYYDKGGQPPTGFQIIIKECDYYSECYKKKLRQEENRIAEEKLRQESIERKEKYEATLKKGNIYFQEKRYNAALVEYNSAKAIDASSEISSKIETTKNEIKRINELRNSCYETYAYIRKKEKAINQEKIDLKEKLSSLKKIYGKNYELSMDQLSSNFSNYTSKLSQLNTNVNDRIVGGDWDSNEQSTYEVLVQFQNEFKTYEKFHNAINEALSSKNEEKLKILKLSEDTQQIISKFLE